MTRPRASDRPSPAIAVSDGTPVFAGTTVPLRRLAEHLTDGDDLDAFLLRFPTVSREAAQRVLALGVELLLAEDGALALATQRHLFPLRDEQGVILNPRDLTAGAVVRQRVVCPACQTFVFRRWPEGWDSHAEHRCLGVHAPGGEARKAEFKARFAHLFR